MGYKELLMILASIVIVGVAISASFKIFNDQSFKSNKSSLASEMTQYTRQLTSYWERTAEFGGAEAKNVNITVAKLSVYLGFKQVGSNYTYTSANGEFRIISATTASGVVTVTMKALGKNKKNNKYPLVTTTIKFTQDTVAPIETFPLVIATTLGEAATF